MNGFQPSLLFRMEGLVSAQRPMLRQRLLLLLLLRTGSFLAVTVTLTILMTSSLGMAAVQ